MSALKAQAMLLRCGLVFEGRAQDERTPKYTRPSIMRLARECYKRQRAMNKVVKALLDQAPVSTKRTLARGAKTILKGLKNGR